MGRKAYPLNVALIVTVNESIWRIKEDQEEEEEEEEENGCRSGAKMKEGREGRERSE